jgi:hypothetical protein
MLVIYGTDVLDNHTNSKVLSLHCGDTFFPKGNEQYYGHRNLGVGRLLCLRMSFIDVPDTPMIRTAVRSESRCALRLRYVDLVVCIEVAVEVCCCLTVFSC